jgi:beta-glucosidase
MRWLHRSSVAALAAVLAGFPALAEDRSAGQPAHAPDSVEERATSTVDQMTADEMLTLTLGHVGIDLSILGGMPGNPPLPGARNSAGYVEGVPRLGISPLWETDAMLGIGNLRDRMRPGDTATAFPSTLVLAASFDTELAQRAGAALGSEAHRKGYNVVLGPGLNQLREPRNGRNFEYFSEDPLVTGLLGGAMIRGIQDEHVVAVAKHFALNSTQVNQNTLDARIDEAALRESELLGFQIAIEQGRPGSVMCSYNGLNGLPTCNNPWLLSTVLKDQWKFDGWVMSDWGATKGAHFADAGLDQESGSEIDAEPWFGDALRRRVAAGETSEARLRDMALRIVRTQYRLGLDRHPAERLDSFDPAPGSAVALEIARRGIVLLKNDGILPLRETEGTIATIGGFADRGVIRGSGSSEVTPTNGKLFVMPAFDENGYEAVRNPTFLPSSPVAALREKLPLAMITYDPGMQAKDAALSAHNAETVIIFLWRHETETRDSPDMRLPLGQDELVEAVLEENPNVVVVVQSGNPVLMPWADKVKAIIWAGFPGQEGGKAIAEVLTGAVNPSGRLPFSLYRGHDQLPFPALPNQGEAFFKPVSVDYKEGADVGYRWLARTGQEPLFAFGHGLSYTSFAAGGLSLLSTEPLRFAARLRNTGGIAGRTVAQLYLVAGNGAPTLRLAGFAPIEIAPGEEAPVTFAVDPRVIGRFDASSQRWVLDAGTYRFALGASASELGEALEITLPGLTLAP